MAVLGQSGWMCARTRRDGHRNANRTIGIQLFVPARGSPRQEKRLRAAHCQTDEAEARRGACKECSTAAQRRIAAADEGREEKRREEESEGASELTRVWGSLWQRPCASPRSAMTRSSCVALVYRSLFGLLALLLCCVALCGHASTCPPSNRLSAGDKVYVGIFVWLLDEPAGLYTGRLAGTKATTAHNYGTSFVQPAQLAIDLYVKMMRDRGGVLPLNSGINVTVEFVYINLNLAVLPLDYGSTETLSNGYPLTMVASTFPPGTLGPGTESLSASYAGNSTLGIPPGLYRLATSTDITLLQQHFGISQPFTYLVPAVFTQEEGFVELANLVEDAQSHVLMAPFIVSQETLICSDIPGRTPDCEGAPYFRNRLPGARRYETMFSTLVDSTPNQNAALDCFHTQGVKSVVVIETHSSSFTETCAAYTVEAAEQLNIQVLEYYSMRPGTCDYYGRTTGQVDIGCPPSLIHGQNHTQRTVFPNQTAFDVAAFLAATQPDALIIIGDPETNAAWSLARLFDGMRTFGYSPKAISVSGSVDHSILPFLTNQTDLFGALSSKPWDPRLTGSKYRNERTPTQFELLPTVGNVYGPRAFQNAYEAEYGPTAHWGANGSVGAHPMYDPTLNDPSLHAIAWGAMTQIQKLIEYSETLDVPSILIAALKVSAPSAYQPVQFDHYGRTMYVNEVLVQKTNEGPVLISPYSHTTPHNSDAALSLISTLTVLLCGSVGVRSDIGSPPIYPLPTWSEREFHPQWYAEIGEQFLVSVSAVCIALCLALVVFVLRHWKSAVIRAATPSCCLAIIAGAILMLTSNFFATLRVNDQHCAASVWMLTTGFTCVFATLFIKTFR